MIIKLKNKKSGYNKEFEANLWQMYVTVSSKIICPHNNKHLSQEEIDDCIWSLMFIYYHTKDFALIHNIELGMKASTSEMTPPIQGLPYKLYFCNYKAKNKDCKYVKKFVEKYFILRESVRKHY